jgi:MYXO-CTERM domain-containing protein
MHRPLFSAALATALALVALPAAADVYTVTPADDLPAAIAALQPGDELVLGGGTYSIAQLFEIGVSGTADQPIVIRAADGETPIITRPDANQNVVNVVGSYVVLRGLEITGGSRGVRLQTGASFVTIEDCRIHDTAANAIAANDTGSSYAGIVIRHNEISHTGGNGEGMYLGCNDDGCQFHEGLIEQNWVHDTNGPTVDQGDGIEIKEGSWGNVVRDNVIHDTGYPCIITYSTVGNGPANVIERNFMYACGDHGIQSAADAIIRNNIILGAASDGIRNQPHQAGSPANLMILHNTILKPAGDAIRSDGIVGSVLIANNAVYAQSGAAIRVAGDLTAVNVAGNVGQGSVIGVSTGWSATGTLGEDFVAAMYSGAPPNDVFPKTGSHLVGTADNAFLAMDDFNGTSRDGALDAGAYKYDAAGNPGWVLASGFKDAVPTTSTTTGAGGGATTGSGGGAGATGSGGASGSGGGAAADGGGSDDGCGCRIANEPGPRAAGGLALGLALLAIARRRARRRVASLLRP